MAPLAALSTCWQSTAQGLDSAEQQAFRPVVEDLEVGGFCLVRLSVRLAVVQVDTRLPALTGPVPAPAGFRVPIDALCNG